MYCTCSGLNAFLRGKKCFKSPISLFKSYSAACCGCRQLFWGHNVRALGSYHPSFVSAHREAPVDDLFWKLEAEAFQHSGQDGE